MKIILPVAGKGERMRPYTNNLPKCLLPVGGKTIIDWIVGDTRPLAPTETIFITGYKAEAMDRYLAGKPEWGKTRTVLQSDPQGLGQTISLALPYASDDEPLLIILGDTLFDADLGRLAGESENVLYTTRCRTPDASAWPSPAKMGVPCCAGAGFKNPAAAGSNAVLHCKVLEFPSLSATEQSIILGRKTY